MDTGLRATLLNHCAWHLRVHPLSTTLLVSWELPFETQFSLLPPQVFPKPCPALTTSMCLPSTPLLYCVDPRTHSNCTLVTRGLS